MKHTYQRPVLHIIRLTAQQMLCASVLAPDGGSNTDLVPGQGEYNGEFNSHRGGWSSDNWSEE